MKTIRLQVNGIVQGVGFRPFVYRLATELNCTGWVMNSPDGVIIELSGSPASVDEFQQRFPNEIPPLARLESLETTKLANQPYDRFEIRESDHTRSGFSLIAPDIAICPDCTREMFDPKDRRYRYPFINCTNCGPRYTIIQEMPYDRPATTMAEFEMCPECAAEYHDPLNRRFHAQPIACPVCGPQIRLLTRDGKCESKENALQQARELIKAGSIVAVKGIGGYLLACDAHNTGALELLRQRKHRSEKAFALMAFNVETIRRYCQVSSKEEDLLNSHQAPIVLMQSKGKSLPELIAPGQNTLGMMLPYSPLHLLLCETGKDYPDLLVMTSGNISEEPIIHQDEELTRLLSLADAVLSHDRKIHVRNDDSVFRIFNDHAMPIRRSRGLAPEPIRLLEPLPDVLACGALLKNTFTFIHKDQAFTSHFIGDLENLETYRSFTEAIDHFQRTYHFDPTGFASDLHPDFLSSSYAAERSCQENKPLIQVQHHHAHLAACLAENGQANQPAICLSYDGTGLGDDGTIWGGEVLLGDYLKCERLFHLEEMPLPGGDTAIHNPYRIALAYLHASGITWDEDLPPVKHAKDSELRLLRSQLEQRINTVQTSSMGRLFDAVSALIGIRQVISYEGQAAIELEQIAIPGIRSGYNYEIESGVILLKNLFSQIIADLRSGIGNGTIAAKFIETVTRFSLEVCQLAAEENQITTVAMSGGVWQNKVLFERTYQLLREARFNVLSHHLLPPNDGCISLGQAVIAAYRLKEME